MLHIAVHDTLQPERARVFARALRVANRDGYAAVLVDLSTPGGMASSADAMVQAMQQSRIPVVVWVDAAETRVSGEGLKLIAAADVALMHSGAYLTPLWTDHARSVPAPVRADMSLRLMQQLTRLNQQHRRDDTALEELTFGTHWYTAQEAAERHLVDGTAERVSDVLRLLNSGQLPAGNRVTLPNLQAARVETRTPQPQEQLLLTLMNPDVAVLLLTLGMLLIYLEINTPGSIVPGAAGLLLVLLAAYALHLLPLGTGGLLLCILASLLLLSEGRFPLHGLLASSGVVCLILGLATLVRGPVPQLEVRWSVALGCGLGFGGVTAALVVLGLRARRAKVKVGSDALLGWLAIAQTELDPEGEILVRGELWHARLAAHDSSVAEGERVKVLRVDGNLLEVTALPLADGP